MIEGMPHGTGAPANVFSSPSSLWRRLVSHTPGIRGKKKYAVHARDELVCYEAKRPIKKRSPRGQRSLVFDKRDYGIVFAVANILWTLAISQYGPPALGTGRTLRFHTTTYVNCFESGHSLKNGGTDWKNAPNYRSPHFGKISERRQQRMRSHQPHKNHNSGNDSISS